MKEEPDITLSGAMAIIGTFLLVIFWMAVAVEQMIQQ